MWKDKMFNSRVNIKTGSELMQEKNEQFSEVSRYRLSQWQEYI